MISSIKKLFNLHKLSLNSISIKHRLSIHVFFLVSIIVLGYTTITYYQYVSAQKDKIISEANTIISPFYDVIRNELPDDDISLDLYLSVAFHAKESSQVPHLIQTYKELKGIGFINPEGKEILRYGNLDALTLRQKKEFDIDGEHISIKIPFEVKGKNLGHTVMIFSSSQFDSEKEQILINGILFLVIFWFLGLLGAQIVGSSIATPIELLSEHIKHNQLVDIPLLSRQDEIGEFSRTIINLALSLKERERELEAIAYYDALTNLPTRRLFIDRLQIMLNEAERQDFRLAVLFIDLNKFKYVNDNYGHDSGDFILQQVAERMLSVTRKSDILARISGDEFTLLLCNHKSEADIGIFCQKVFKLFERPFDIKQGQIYMSISIGIAIYPNDGEDVEPLINNADRAMYQAKKFGGNQYRFYCKEFQRHYSERLKLESSLRQAITNRDIELHYQPQILLSNGEVRGIEALARWKHPILGDIPPTKFVSIAEEAGLIEPLTRLIVQKACKQMADWLKKGLSAEVKIAINLSALDFDSPNLTDTIKNTLTNTDLPSINLELEITETTTINQPETVIKVTNSFSNMGINIAIDDFGTGHSSLSRLHNLKPSSLKIDRSFVQDMENSKHDQQFVNALISMAQALNIDVVVEGIETKAQLDIISAMKIPTLKVQGYFYSKPLTAKAFAKYAKLD